MKKDISIIGADLWNLDFLGMRRLWSDVATKFWPLIEAGHIKPIIGKIFTFAEAAEARRALEEGCIPGKLLLVPQETTLRDFVNNLKTNEPFSCLENASSPNSCY